MSKFPSGVLLFTLVGCTDAPTTPVSPWPLTQLGVGDLYATGVSNNLTTGNLWFLAAGIGLVEATPAGRHVSTLPFDAHFVDYGFTDAVVLDDGSFALTANGEGYRYDPAVGEAAFFCLVPGDGQTAMENEAITIDRSSSTIYVAPIYRNGADIVSASIGAYAASDGHLLSSLDVKPTGVVAQGMAVDRSDGTQRLWIVQHDTIYRFAMDGTILGQTQLTGISDAAGVALVADQFYVLDGATQRVHLFDRATILAELN